MDDIATDNVFVDLDENGESTGHFVQETEGFGGGLDGQIEALMTPRIGEGVRRLPTNLDFSALEDIGWEVNVAAVPLPAAVWLFGTGLGLLGFKKRYLA